jgi:hypothetical protein
MEERDLAIQLFAQGWRVCESGDLRVFHDTDLKHHESREITSGVIANVGLYAFLHYPLVGWWRGFLQVANIVVYSFRRGRIRGIGIGLLSIPLDCWRNRQHRMPVSRNTLRIFNRFRKTGVSPIGNKSGSTRCF